MLSAVVGLCMACGAHRIKSNDAGLAARCGGVTALWEPLPNDAEHGRWLVDDGVTRASEITYPSGPGGPFSPDCTHLVLLEGSERRLAVYPVSASDVDWGRPVLVDLPSEHGKVCEVIGLGWHDTTRLSFWVGCSGWHGVMPVIVDTTDPEHWLSNGAELCRMAPASSQVECQSRPFDWRK